MEARWDDALAARIEAWAAGDVDEQDRATLTEALAAARGGSDAHQKDLIDRFQGPLKFGTAGLRGLIGPGEHRMNAAVVVRATYGLARHLEQTVPDAKARGVALGRDARRGSERYQAEAARVLAGLGFRVHWIPGVVPTPVTAYAVQALRAAAGIQVTASHNPPDYNGYKVYWENGAQIIPPQDAGIAAAIAAAPLAQAIERPSLASALESGAVIERADLVGQYVEAVQRANPAPDGAQAISLAYSALHGVGEATLRQVFAARPEVTLHSVERQADPDGRFPTLRFPNPEEPDTWEEVLALAERTGVHLALLNDPDADRLGVAVRRQDGDAFRVLNGNEIGWLLADYLLGRHKAAPGRPGLAVTTVVSSGLLTRIAEAHGAKTARTLTGFKWIANEGLRQADAADFVFGYEEALGFCVGTAVRDKDGISAALVIADMASVAAARGQSLLDALDALEARFGLHHSDILSITLPGAEGAAQIRQAMATLRAAAPTEWAGTPLVSTWDLQSGRRRDARGQEEEVSLGATTDAIIYALEGGSQLAVRPSGTEPKLKIYVEVVEEGEGAKLRAETRAQAMLADVRRVAGLD